MAKANLSQSCRDRQRGIVGAVKVAGVRTASDESVSLLFARTGVLVIGRSARQNRLLRFAGGTVFAAAALGAAAIGVGHMVQFGVGLLLTGAAVILIALSAVLAVVASVMAGRERRRFRSGELEPTIGVESVVWARSAGDQGRVTVTVALKDDAVHEFTVAGPASVQLARGFADMLQIEAPPGPGIVAST